MTGKKILCIKWGTRYGPEYVNRIYAMVARNLTPPFQVICFTDDRRGIRRGLVPALPELHVELQNAKTRHSRRV